MPLYLKRRFLAETNLYFFSRMRSSPCLFLLKCVCLCVVKRYNKPSRVYTYPRSLVTHHSTDTVKTSVSLKTLNVSNINVLPGSVLAKISGRLSLIHGSE